jgi:hypothetical protein
LIYIELSYNRSIHTSTNKSPFVTYFGYFPPSPLDVVYGKHGGEKEYATREALKDKIFFNEINKIHIGTIALKKS